MKTKTIKSSDPKVHARNIGKMLEKIASHLRKETKHINEPKAQALFETAAEVIIGLRTACKHYETGEERAMR